VGWEEGKCLLVAVREGDVSVGEGPDLAVELDGGQGDDEIAAATLGVRPQVENLLAHQIHLLSRLRNLVIQLVKSASTLISQLLQACTRGGGGVQIVRSRARVAGQGKTWKHRITWELIVPSQCMYRFDWKSCICNQAGWEFRGKGHGKSFTSGCVSGGGGVQSLKQAISDLLNKITPAANSHVIDWRSWLETWEILIR